MANIGEPLKEIEVTPISIPVEEPIHVPAPAEPVKEPTPA